MGLEGTHLEVAVSKVDSKDSQEENLQDAAIVCCPFPIIQINNAIRIWTLSIMEIWS